jgi:hypothetical protein
MRNMPNLETQNEPHIFYGEFENLPGGSNTIWPLPPLSFVIPIGYYFILSNVRAVVTRHNNASMRGPLEMKISVESSARAMRMFEDGVDSLNLYGSVITNELRDPALNGNFPVSQVVSFQEIARPIPYADLIVVKGEFLSGSLNSGAKQVGVCLVGNLAPVRLG